MMSRTVPTCHFPERDKPGFHVEDVRLENVP